MNLCSSFRDQTTSSDDSCCSTYYISLNPDLRSGFISLNSVSMDVQR